MNEILDIVKNNGIEVIPFDNKNVNLKSYLNLKNTDLRFLNQKSVEVVISTKENYSKASYKAYMIDSNFKEYRENPNFDFFLVTK